MPNGQPQLPGGQVLAVIMAAPTDIMGLMTRQMTEAMSTFNVGIQRFAAAAVVPPALPAGLPAVPAGFPPFPFPGMTPAGYTPPAPTPAAAGAPRVTFAPTYRATVQV